MISDFWLGDFNTSYVVIKLGGIGTMIIKHFNFNTSYVVIKRIST